MAFLQLLSLSKCLHCSHGWV